jgi:hypothetical protein
MAATLGQPEIRVGTVNSCKCLGQLVAFGAPQSEVVFKPRRKLVVLVEDGEVIVIPG